MGIEQIIEDIQSEHTSKRNKALRYLYEKCFPQVKRFVTSNNGGIEEAEDVFQDAIATVYLNLTEGRFRGESSLYTYVHSVARNTWLMKLRKKKLPVSPLKDEILSGDEAEETVDTSVIQKVMGELDEPCRQVLVGFYFKSMTMQEIAKSFGLGSPQAAKTKKLRCMKRLNRIVQDQGLQQDHFMQ